MSYNHEKDSTSTSGDVEVAHNAIEPENISKHEPPDGGLQAWLVTLGCSLAFFASFGIINSYGVFQDYYTSHVLSDSSSSTISIIGAFQLFLLYGLGSIVGRIYDAYGAALVLRTGTFILVLSVMIIPLCKELYQLFLVQGLLFGIGNSLIFTPCLAVVAQWFKKRRSLIMGTLGAASSLGGVVYPILIQQLIPKVGFAWAVRIAGFLSMACLSVSCITVKQRLVPKGGLTFKGIVDFNGFKDIQYTLAAIGSFLYFYAYFIPLFYIQLYGTQHGLNTGLSNYLLVIMNALGIPARILPGHLADRFGILEVLVPLTLLSAISVFVLWLPFQSSGPILAFSALYGLFSGALLPLLPAFIATRSPPEKLGARMGSLYIFVGISCLVGTPTAGAFLPSFTQTSFEHLIIFTGVMLTASNAVFTLCYILARRKIGSIPL